LWIGRVEQAGIFVFRQGRLELEEVRGFVVSDGHSPFIFINSDDAKAAMIFTLAHELAHLWLDESGISNLEPSKGRRNDEAVQIEQFCNKVAAEAVLKHVAFIDFWRKLDRSAALEDRIERVSREFKVSEEVVARRLRDMRSLTTARYLELRRGYQERWRQHKERETRRMKERGRGPSYYVSKIFNNGYSFTETVVTAFSSGAISGREASGLLDVKVNNLPRLATTAGIVLSGKRGRN
jgi:Zn-dependent peptidase ImmA (M78 family)